MNAPIKHSWRYHAPLALLLAINLISPEGKLDPLYLSNYATIQVKDELMRLNGVGDITLHPGDQGLFKAVSLRNIEYAGPYMHDGRLATPDDVAAGRVRIPAAACGVRRP